MTEKIEVKGKDVWIMVEPHARHATGNDPQEYFTASYHFMDPATNPAGSLFSNEDGSPKTFLSPVEALEFGNEALLSMIKDDPTTAS